MTIDIKIGIGEALLNDKRAAIKKKINQLYNSEFVEEKSYK